MGSDFKLDSEANHLLIVKLMIWFLDLHVFLFYLPVFLLCSALNSFGHVLKATKNVTKHPDTSTKWRTIQ